MKLNRILLTSCVLSFSSVAFATTAFWSGIQGNAAHTGYVVQKTNPANYHVLWKKNLINSNKTPTVLVISQPVVTDHAVYYSIEVHDAKIGSKYFIAALNLANGKDMWRQDWNLPLMQPAFLDNQIIVSTLNTDGLVLLQSYQSETGKLIYSTHSDNSLVYSDPVTFDHQIYLSGSYKVVSAEAATGQTLWAKAFTENLKLFAIPAVDDNYVYQLHSNGLYVMTRDGGQLVSSISVGDYASWTNFPSAPVLDVKNNALYHVFRSGSGLITLQALDLAAGKVKWLLKYVDAQVVIADNDIYGVSTDIKTNSRQLSNIDALTGEIQWSWQPSNDSLSIGYAPVVTDDTVFVTGAKNTYALSRKTHKVVWSIAKTGELALGNGELLIRSGADITAIALR